MQKICRLLGMRRRSERFSAIWRNPEKDTEILAEAAVRNRDIYEFEKMLERG